MLVVREMEKASNDGATTSEGVLGEIGSSEEDGNELGRHWSCLSTR